MLSRLCRAFRRRRDEADMTPEKTLAQAVAARQHEEAKHPEAEAATARLDRLEQENDLAARFRKAFGGRP